MKFPDRWSIQDLIPHRGAMCFLDELVLANEKEVVCQGIVRPDNPLLDHDRLPGWALLEFLAQAAAVLQGFSAAHGEASPLRHGLGYLTSIFDAQFVEPYPRIGERLTVSLQRESLYGPWASFQGEVIGEDGRICQGRITVRGIDP